MRPDLPDYSIISGTLVGLGVIAIVQMLSANSMDLPLKVSVFSFAVSIPANSVVVLCLISKGEHGTTVENRFVMAGIMGMILTGLASSLIGITAVFFHFTKYAGVVFIAICTIGGMFWLLYEALSIRGKP